MPVLRSDLDTREQSFADNAAYHEELSRELDRRLARAAEGGGEKARAKHVARGKRPVRARTTALTDPGSPVPELTPTAAEEHKDEAHRARTTVGEKVRNRDWSSDVSSSALHARPSFRPGYPRAIVRRQRRLPRGAVARTRPAPCARGRRRRREGARKTRRTRQAAGTRPHHRPARPGFAVPRNRAARRRGNVRRCRARPAHGLRPRQGARAGGGGEVGRAACGERGGQSV